MGKLAGSAHKDSLSELVIWSPNNIMFFREKQKKKNALYPIKLNSDLYVTGPI